MYKVAICDDSQSYLQYLRRQIEELNVGNLSIYEYRSGKELLQHISLMHDIIILDIQLGDSDGNQIAAKLRQINRNAVLALCSGVMSPTPMAFVVDAYRYIMKKDSDDKIQKVLWEIFREADRRFRVGYLVGESSDIVVRVRIDDILYISKLKYGSEIHVNREEGKAKSSPLVSKYHLSKLYEQLRDQGFEYAHSSYIVNCRHVQELQKDQLKLCDGELLSVSRSMRKRFTEKLTGSLAGKYGDDW